MPENSEQWEDSRVNAILVVCFLTSLPMIALFISAAAAGELTALHFITMLILIGVMFTMSGVVWYLSEQTNLESSEKAKRDRLEHVLRNLSDSELVVLKQRLSDEAIDDEVLYAHLTDDGEIAYEQKSANSDS